MGGFANNAPIVTDGLVFYVDAGNIKSYPGTGTTWSDLVESNDGSLINSPTYSSDNGGSIVFDGSNQRVSTSSALSITGGSGTSQTYDIWFKVDSTAALQGVFGWDSYNYVGVNTGGEVIIVTNGDNSIGDFSVTPTLSTNTWYNAVFVFDQGAAYKLHLNGVDYGTAATSDTSPVSTKSAIIGARYQAGSTIDAYFDGQIASIKAYNRQLSSTEVLQNYNALKNRFV